MQVKREGDVDQHSVIPTSSLILPSTSTSNSTPDTRPNLDANCSANLDDRSGTEEKRQRAAVQQEAALSPPQDPLTPLPSPPFPKHQQAVPTLILELDSVMAKPANCHFVHIPQPRPQLHSGRNTMRMLHSQASDCRGMRKSQKNLSALI